jgi:hypothetical protein
MLNYISLELRNKDGYYYDERGPSSEQDSHGSHNIMSIQSMLNNSSNAVLRQDTIPDDDEGYSEKSWRQTEKKRNREVKQHHLACVDVNILILGRVA